jgi:hypothetical protein
MKNVNSLLLIFIGLFLVLKTDAQPAQTQLNQNELMKKFIGSWYTEGTYLSSEIRQFGPFSLEGYQKTQFKDSVLAYYQLMFGYDKANDRYICAAISKNGNQIIMRSYRFVSENVCESTPLENVDKGQQSEKAILEFKSPDVIIGTYKDSNGNERVYKQVRGKNPV